MKKLFEAASVYFNKKTAAVGVGVSTIVVASSAQAAYVMPTAITTAFADMSAAWTAIEAEIWPILAVVVIGFFVIKMFKKGANKVG